MWAPIMKNIVRNIKFSTHANFLEEMKLGPHWFFFQKKIVDIVWVQVQPVPC